MTKRAKTKEKKTNYNAKMIITDFTMQAIAGGFGNDKANIDFAMLQPKERDTLLNYNLQEDNVKLIYSLCRTIRLLNKVFCEVAEILKSDKPNQVELVKRVFDKYFSEDAKTK